jgi:hypothetical protein
MFETQEHLQSACARYPNVHFLCHDSPAVYLPKENVAVLGTTLWSHVPTDMKAYAQRTMNDYNFIPVREEDSTFTPLDPDTTNILHAKERTALATQIDYWGAKRAQVCVITHHMPSVTFISPRFQDHPLNVCFTSSCEDLMGLHVRAWIYGHTRNCATSVVGNTVCAVNARGYPHEVVPGFRTDAWLEFPTYETDVLVEYDELVAATNGVKPYNPVKKISGFEEDIEFL